MIIRSKRFIASDLGGCGDLPRGLKFRTGIGRSNELRGFKFNLPNPGQFEHWRFCRRHRRRISVNFRGQNIFAPKICMKIFLNARIFMTFARKIRKKSEFCMIFLPENVRILHNNCPKNIFPDFFFLGGGRGARAPCPPVSYAYGRRGLSYTPLAYE